MILPEYFHSRGKILLSGEYLILHGAKALALPTLMGQSLNYIPGIGDEGWVWETQIRNHRKLRIHFDTELKPLEISTDGMNPTFLLECIKAVKELKSGVPIAKKGGQLIANLEFPSEWGLGSSSTLISNLAQFFEIDPFTLHFAVSKGSGYDIACATSNKPIFYTLKNQKPEFSEAPFNPSFQDQLYFLYLGNKQDSAAEVKKFLSYKKISESDLNSISFFSEAMAISQDLHEFSELVREHEKLLSGYLGVKPIKQEYFSNFEGEIKSLGAWGGDFALLITKNPKKYLIDYFFAKNLNQIFSFERLIHTRIEGYTEPASQSGHED